MKTVDGPVFGCPFCGAGAAGELSVMKATLPLGGIMYAVLCAQCRTVGPRKRRPGVEYAVSFSHRGPEHHARHGIDRRLSTVRSCSGAALRNGKRLGLSQRAL